MIQGAFGKKRMNTEPLEQIRGVKMLGNDESEMIDIHDASIGAARHFEGIELREGIMSLVHRLNPTC